MKSLLDTPQRLTFSKDLPTDPIKDNSSRQVHGACFSSATPRIPSSPSLVHVSDALLNDFGLTIKDKDEFVQIMSGAKPFNEFAPYSMCYGGHQFGNWAGQLGDGRAINIVELDIKGTNWKFQLKGAGRTPYSRGADGLAVLRSSIREYLCSEAMHHLGVPTTRALSLVKTGDSVMRDLLYNGNQKLEPGAVVCRTAPSFIRFGSFEIFSARQDIDSLRTLVDYTIKNHFPELGPPSIETYLAFFKKVVESTLELVIHWQRVGFVHGVLNTDNMSILGLTIDFGPYGWLENYDPNWTPNTTDAQHHRYGYGKQPQIGMWNLTRLANALYPLIEDVKPLQDILDGYNTRFHKQYLNMMKSKLGLEKNENTDPSLMDDLQNLLEKSNIDMTLFFRQLAEFKESESFLALIQDASYASEDEFIQFKIQWQNWLSKYENRLKIESHSVEDRSVSMNKVNPKFVLRNYMAQLAIDDAENGDNYLLDELYQLLRKPYDDQPEMEKWFAKRPDWAEHKVGCSMLSCSS